jgi:hypothetical protein
VKFNLGSADRTPRAFVVAPVFLGAGVLVGPVTAPAIVLYALQRADSFRAVASLATGLHRILPLCTLMVQTRTS